MKPRLVSKNGYPKIGTRYKHWTSPLQRLLENAFHHWLTNLSTPKIPIWQYMGMARKHLFWPHLFPSITCPYADAMNLTLGFMFFLDALTLLYMALEQNATTKQFGQSVNY
jgi:hypothetical protein